MRLGATFHRSRARSSPYAPFTASSITYLVIVSLAPLSLGDRGLEASAGTFDLVQHDEEESEEALGPSALSDSVVNDGVEKQEVGGRTID